MSDHDVVTCDMMAEVLAGEGYHVRCCRDSWVSPTDLAHTLPDLAIVELHPVGMQRTISLLAQILQHAATQSLPVIVSSTNPRLFDQLMECIPGHGCVTLLKPFNLGQFLECITDMLSLQHPVGCQTQQEQVYG